MRVLIAGPVAAHAGQSVSMHARLRKDGDGAFISVFAAEGEAEPSPYVAVTKTMMLRDGRPQFVTPTTMRLTRHHRPKHEITVVAEEDCTFYLMQEVDVESDVRAIGRIYPHGSSIFVHARRWFYRVTGW